MAEASIAALAPLIASLPCSERDLVERLLLVTESTGPCLVPASMRPWAAERFGSVEAVERQRVVRATNRFTLEGATFNPLRGVRPMERSDVCLDEVVAESAGDPFCSPLEATPEDSFGRVAGRFCVTASNVAKCEGAHGLLVFDCHDPRVLSAERIVDYFATAVSWFGKAHAADSEAAYPFFMWNSLWRAGASVVHGHAQMVLTRGMHFPHVERWRRAWLEYRCAYGGDFVDDLITAHSSLGLAWAEGDVRGMAYLAPAKENEVVLVAPEFGEPLARSVATVLACFTEELGVRSFDVAVWLPPLAARPESWAGFPVVAHVVDRGDLGSRVSDVGAIELYAASVVAGDPFRTARCVRARLSQSGRGES